MSVLRPAAPADAPFLAEMLAVALDWRPGVRPRPVADVLRTGMFARYVEDWPRDGDRGVVAESDPGPDQGDLRLLGAAWARRFDPDARGYGFVDAAIPEVTIGVVAGERGRGLGGRLLGALIDDVREQGRPGLSLSVEPENPARRLYERFGFRPVGGAGGAVTMLLELVG